MPAESSSRPPSPARSLRLIFEVEGDQVRLVSRQRVTMIPPALGAPEPGPQQAGFWVRLHAGDDAVLFARPMESPLRRDVEVFDPDPARSLSRRPVERPRSAFVVLVPDVPEARFVALASSPVTAEAAGGAGFTAAEPAREIARFALDEGVEAPR